MLQSLYPVVNKSWDLDPTRFGLQKLCIDYSHEAENERFRFAGGLSQSDVQRFWPALRWAANPRSLASARLNFQDWLKRWDNDNRDLSLQKRLTDGAFRTAFNSNCSANCSVPSHQPTPWHWKKCQRLRVNRTSTVEPVYFIQNFGRFGMSRSLDWAPTRNDMW